MSAVATERTIEYCPSARSESFMKNGTCQFCFTDHKLASKLTREQRQILRLLANGQTMKQVSAQLHVNYNTVSHRLRDARLMLDAKTTEHMIALLAREGSI